LGGCGGGGSFDAERCAWNTMPRNRQIDNKHGIQIKQKDLAGIPWRVALALQADGWWLRSAMTWCKTNPQPESCVDRPTSATEMIFLLTKSASYFYDQDAARVPSAKTTLERDKYTRITTGKDGQYAVQHDHETPSNPGGRNMWNYVLCPTESYPGAHYAIYPRKLIEPFIRVGTSEKGCCPRCGAPWERIANGWQPTCNHDLTPVPCVIFDPFIGSGTTIVVANALGRHGIGLDLSREYLVRDAKRRIERPHASVKRPARKEFYPMFDGPELVE
jgi:DNA modification methylase